MLKCPVRLHCTVMLQASDTDVVGKLLQPTRGDIVRYYRDRWSDCRNRLLGSDRLGCSWQSRWMFLADNVLQRTQRHLPAMTIT